MRFFERVKFERRIRRLQAAAQSARRAGGEPAPADATALAQAQDDLQVRSGVLSLLLPRWSSAPRGLVAAPALITPFLGANS